MVLLRLLSRCFLFIATLFATTFASTTPQAHPLKPAVSQSAGGGFWRVDHSFKSTIALTNVLEIAPITVTPVLYMADGTRYVLDPVTLEVAGVASIDINAALSNAPAAIQSHISDFGSASIEYSWSWSGAVLATVENLDVPRSMVFHFPLRAAPKRVATASKISKEGLWWKHDDDIGGFVAVTNTSKAAISAHLSVFPSGAGRHSERDLSLPGGTTQRIDLGSMLGELDKASEGGITVTYRGAPSDLNVSGGLENAVIGYSAKIPFLTKGGTPDTSQFMTASVGVMVGDADPMMMFPAGTKFAPYAVFRNINEKKTLIAPSVQYMDGSGPRTTRLEPFELKGNASVQMDLPKALARVGLDRFSGEMTLLFSSTASSDDLLLATGSVDQTGTYVFEVECKGVGASDAKMLAKWSVSDGNDTMVSLWNSGDKDQDLAVTLYFSGGQYKYPVHLAKNASSMFNVSEIIMMQMPDADGNVIPASVKNGSAVLSGARGESEHINIGVSVGTFNVKTATCGTTCPTCLGYTDFYVSPTPNDGSLGSSLSYTSTAINQRGGSSDQTFNSSWTSDNSSVGSSQGSGTYSGVGVGSFFATASIQLMDPNPDCPDTGHSPCPTSPSSGGGNGLVSTPVQHNYPSNPLPQACKIIQFFDHVTSAGNRHSAEDVVFDGPPGTTPYGTSVSAMEAGTVVKIVNTAGPASVGYPACQGGAYPGNRVNIRGSDNYVTVYYHVMPLAGITVGTTVTQGQQIGTLDNSGCQSAPHTHIGRIGPSGAVNFTIPCVNQTSTTNFGDGTVDDDDTDLP